MRLVDRILVCIYLAIVALPVTAMLLHLHDHRLNGALAPAPRPALTLSGFRAEQYQKGFTSWFENKMGFRNYAVYADNGLLYHAFREAKPGAQVIIGHDGVLFHREDISLFNKFPVVDQARIDALADEIARVQHSMAAKHRAFIPVIIPSKTTLYRDEIPESFQLPLGEPRPSDGVYVAIKRALDARGVAYVDAHELFTTSSEPRERLWASEARHWSYYGACLVWQKIAAQYRTLTSGALDYDCIQKLTYLTPKHDDYDLLRLLNGWAIPHRKIIHAIALHAPAPPGPKPSAILISSSFGWTLIKDAARSGRFSALYSDYYDKEIVSWPGEQGARFTSKHFTSHGDALWQDAFRDRDIYVYEMFETYLFNDDVFTRVLDEFDPDKPSGRVTMATP